MYPTIAATQEAMNIICGPTKSFRDVEDDDNGDRTRWNVKAGD